ncbi:hypothetical protein D3C79_538160 [compost metagenome]
MGGGADLAIRLGRIVVGQHPDRVFLGVGVEVAHQQHLARQLVHRLAQHLGCTHPKLGALALQIGGFGLAVPVLKAARTLGFQVIDHQRQGILAARHREALHQGVALTGALGDAAQDVTLLRQLNHTGFPARGQLGRAIEHGHHDGVATEVALLAEQRLGQADEGVVLAGILLLGVQMRDQIADGGVLVEAVVLHLHQAEQIGVHLGDGVDYLGALLLEIFQVLGAPVAALGAVRISLILAQHVEGTAHAGVAGEVVEHVEAADAQVGAGGAGRGALAIVLVGAQQIAGRDGLPLRHYQPVLVIAVTHQGLQVDRGIADAQVTLLRLPGGQPGQLAVGGLEVGFEEYPVARIGLCQCLGLAAARHVQLGRFHQRGLMGEHQVVAPGGVVVAEVAADLERAVGIEPHPHPLVTLQRPGQGLPLQHPQWHGGGDAALRQHLQARDLAIQDWLELGMAVVFRHLGFQTDLGPRLDGGVLADVTQEDEDAVRALGVAIALEILQVEALVQALAEGADHRLDGHRLGAFKQIVRDQRALVATALNGGDGGEGVVGRAAEAGGMD